MSKWNVTHISGEPITKKRQAEFERDLEADRRRRFRIVKSGDRRFRVVEAKPSPAQLKKLVTAELRKLSSQLTGLYAELIESGFAPSTMRFVHAIMSRLLGDAQKARLVHRNVASEATVPRVPKRKMSVWTQTERRQFLEHVGDDRLAALWRVLLLVGLRRDEALAAKWLGFDAERGTLTITESLVEVKGVLAFNEPKTDAGRRTVFLDAETIAALEEHRERQLLERSLFGEAYEDHDLIFCREDGAPLRPSTISGRAKRLAKAAKVPPIRLHDLRQTARDSRTRSRHPEPHDAGASRPRLGRDHPQHVQPRSAGDGRGGSRPDRGRYLSHPAPPLVERSRFRGLSHECSKRALARR